MLQYLTPTTLEEMYKELDDARLALLLRDRPSIDLNEQFQYWWSILKKRVDPDFPFGQALPLINRQVVKAGWRKWEKANQR